MNVAKIVCCLGIVLGLGVSLSADDLKYRLDHYNGYTHLYNFYSAAKTEIRLERQTRDVRTANIELRDRYGNTRLVLKCTGIPHRQEVLCKYDQHLPVLEDPRFVKEKR